MKLHRCILDWRGALAALLVGTHAHAGTVWTRQGSMFTGALQIEQTNLVVRANGAPVRIPITDVLRARFDPPGAAISTAGPAALDFQPANANPAALSASNAGPGSPASSPSSNLPETAEPGPAPLVHPGGELLVASGAPGTPPVSWQMVTVGTNVAPLKARASDGGLNLTYAGGSPRQNLDAFGAVVRTVPGDWVFTARLTHLELHGNEAEPIAGMVVQKDFNPGSPRVAYLLDSAETLWRITRTRPGQTPDVAEEKLFLPLWLRLTRSGDAVHFYFSRDGYQWELGDLVGMRLPELAQVGLIAGTPNLESPAAATFDHIRLTSGPPPMESVTKGLLLVNGTLLASGLVGLSTLEWSETKASIALEDPPQRLSFPPDRLARILYRPLATEDAASLHGRQGVLLVNGDFSAGRVRSVRQLEVTVDSVLLGWHVHQVNPEVTCVSLRDPDPQTAPLNVATVDGSRLRVTAIEGNGDRVQLTEPILGTFTIPLRTIRELTAATAGEPRL